MASEWGAKARQLHVANAPSPIIAVFASQVVGGVFFTRFPFPDKKDLVLWLDTLLVIPEHRNRGIAKHLVSKAVVRATDFGERGLYVHTAIPSFYEKQNWTRVEGNGDFSVLCKPC